jgi:hypothetical protein
VGSTNANNKQEQITTAMVEVFKTNVEQQMQAAILSDVLLQCLPHLKVNFDLDDCDRILRVEGTVVPLEKIVEVLAANGYQCFVLE